MKMTLAEWRKWPEISEHHDKNRPAFTERFVFFGTIRFHRPAPHLVMSA